MDSLCIGERVGHVLCTWEEVGQILQPLHSCEGAGEILYHLNIGEVAGEIRNHLGNGKAGKNEHLKLERAA